MDNEKTKQNNKGWSTKNCTRGSGKFCRWPPFHFLIFFNPPQIHISIIHILTYFISLFDPLTHLNFGAYMGWHILMKLPLPQPLHFLIFFNPPQIHISIIHILTYFISLLDPLTHLNFGAYMGWHIFMKRPLPQPLHIFGGKEYRRALIHFGLLILLISSSGICITRQLLHIPFLAIASATSHPSWKLVTMANRFEPSPAKCVYVTYDILHLNWWYWHMTGALILNLKGDICYDYNHLDAKTHFGKILKFL